MVNTVTKYSPEKQVMIEYFSTQCRPARVMVPHMAELTQWNPNTYVISVTNEDTVGEVSELMRLIPSMKQCNVAIDLTSHMSDFIQKYNITNNPRCLLFNVNGDLLWQGHPINCPYNMTNYKRLVQENTQNVKVPSKVEPIVNVVEQPIVK